MRCLSDALNSRRCGQRFTRRAAYTSVSLAAMSLAAGLMLGANAAWAQSVTATGNVTPSGATSPNWTTSSIVVVGATGIGSLAIADGGTVSSLAAYIGHSASGRGTATVSGAGSLWSSTNGVYVGVAGIASLAITAGGVVTSNSDDYIGQLAGSDGNVTVSGTGSRWTGTGTLFVGNAGAGSLDIINGGVVDNRDAYIGYWSGGTGSVSVSGAGSTWTLAGPLTVGNAGSGSLSIAAGGVVSSSHAYIGDWSGGVGTVTVSGTGSSWTIGNSLYVGGSGAGSLSITGGGSVNSLYGFIAADLGSSGTVNVSGAGSQWTNSGNLIVGESGTGALDINAGGTVHNTSGYVGHQAGSTGTATVSGAGSSWTNSGDLWVGTAGNGTLTIERGGKVFANYFTLGFFDSGMGAATVTGAGSSLSADSADVGVFGVGTLAIADGGAVTSSFASIGAYAGSTGAATVTGAGSIWTNSSSISVGGSGTGFLGIAGGGTVNSRGGVIAAAPGSAGAVNVSGSGSIWSMPTDLIVADAGIGSLTISGGGTVSSGDSYIGLSTGGVGTATVSGSGSEWTASGMNVGYEGGTGFLTVETGGRVSTTEGILGRFAGGVGTATVRGAGSEWVNSSLLTVGRDGAGALDIDSGGTVSTNQIYIGERAGGIGTVTVRGTGSSFVTAVTANIGVSGTGTLGITDGGNFSSRDGYIGYSASGVGTATVSGTGSSWANTGALTVATFGSGTLSIADGGVVSAAGGMLLASEAGSVGTLNIGTGGLSGTLNTPTIVGGAGTAVVNFNHTDAIALPPAMSGSLAVNQIGAGTTALTADNTYTGGTTISAGTLQLGNGGTTGSVVGPILNNATLSFNRSNLMLLGSDISGTGAVNQIGSGETRLLGTNSYTGVTTIGAGTLSAGAANVFSTASVHDVGVGGTLDLRGFDQTVGGLSNAGTVSLSGSPLGTVLTVKGAYISNGGSLLLDTLLGDSSSPTDRLVADSVILGSAATRIFVTNLGGLGALTTGNGIELVHVGNPAASAADAFALGSRVAAGAYEYSLGRSMVAGADGNWYLRSTYTGPVVPPVEPPVTPPVTPPVEPPVTPPVTPPVEPPVTPPVVPPSQPPAAELPNYRVEVPVDMVVPALASRLGLAMLGTCSDRTMAALSANGASPCGADRPGTAMWARIFGETGSVGFGGRSDAGRFSNFESHGPSYDVRLGGFQAGMDLWRSPTQGGGLDTAGFYLGAGRVDSDVKAVYGGKAGSTAMNGYSLGAYWTHKAAAGWYVDAVLQGTRYDQIEARSIYAQTLKTSGWGLTASLESGYPIALGAGWTIEPQAQLIYQHIAIDDTGRDRFGLIKYDDVDAVYGRLGGRLSKSWTLGDGRSVTTWARANLWHAFGAQATTTFSSLDGLNPVALKTDLGGSWGQVGLGVSGQLSRNVTVFATGDYNFALDAGKGTSLSGRVGATLTW